MMSRVPDARYLAAAPVAAVAVFAGIVSYSHIYRLAVATGQAGTAARLMPLSVDCLIIAGSVILFQAGARQQWLGWLGVGPGVAATVFATGESGIGHGWLAATVAGWPALAFSLASFMLERWLSSQVRGAAVPAPASAEPRAVTGGAGVPADAATAARAALEESITAGEPLSQRELSRRYGIPRSRAAIIAREVAAAAA